MTGDGTDVRWEQRFTNFKKALSQLKKFVEKSQLNELEEQGAIQAFEYTYELSWNVMKDFLEHQGQTDIYGSRDAIRKAFQLGLITDGDKWMDAYKSRTKTLHTYNEETARELVDAILGVYHGLFAALEEKMTSLLNRDQNAASKNRFGIESSMFERIISVLRDNPLIKGAIIYGSRAKGVHKPGSDIDVVFKGKDLTLQDLNRIPVSRDRIIEALHAENILARKYFWPGCHNMKPYRELYPHAGLVLPNTQQVADSVVVLPTGTTMSRVMVENVTSVIRTIVTA